MDNFNKLSNYLYGLLLLSFVALFYVTDYNNAGLCVFKETYKKKKLKALLAANLLT